MLTPLAQVAAAHHAALALNVPRSSTLLVTGADRVSWLNGLVTCDVVKARPGEVTYGLFVTQKGRVLADVLVVPEPERLVLVVPADARDTITAHLEKYLIMEDAEVAKGTDEVVFLHGPGARVPGSVAYDPTGLGGSVLFGSLPSGVTLGDEIGWEALRVARAVPAFGVDFDDKTYPQEASLEKRAVSFDKGCYLGQEVVCMLEMRGHVKRKLVRLEADVELARGLAVLDIAGQEVGKVSTAAGRAGLAMVKLAHAALGTELRIGEAHARVRAADPA